MTLGETAQYVRSKNAGPFWMTIDIFCKDDAAYQAVRCSAKLTAARVQEVYQAKQVFAFAMDDLRVVKFSMPRPFPQGSAHDADMHAGQQYIRLLNEDL